MFQSTFLKVLGLFIFGWTIMANAKLGSKDFFTQLNSQSMHLIEEFYDEKIVFVDPLGQHSGQASIKEYYTKLYKGAEYVRFEFEDQIKQENSEVLFWKMTLKSPNLNGGNEYTVPGNSHFVFSPTTQKCVYHRDYFDMGDFVYERVPILKSIIRFVKSKLKTNE